MRWVSFCCFVEELYICVGLFALVTVLTMAVVSGCGAYCTVDPEMEKC